MDRTESELRRLWKRVLARNGETGGDPAVWADYGVFREWVLAHGWRHGLWVVRKDTDKGFSPDNCAVASRQEAARYRANRLRVDGVLLKDAARRGGVSYEMARCRVEHGWNVAAALSTPPIASGPRTEGMRRTHGLSAKVRRKKDGS